MPDPVPVVLLARLALDRTEQRKALGAICSWTRCVVVCATAASSERERWSSTRTVRHELLGAPPGQAERAQRRRRLLAAMGTVDEGTYPPGYLEQLDAGWPG